MVLFPPVFTIVVGSQPRRFIRDNWRPRQELNLRPLAPEASALSAELRERDVKNHDEGQSTPRNIGTPSAVLHKAE